MILHRNYYEMAAVVDKMERRLSRRPAPPLPAARAQLRAADPPPGGVHGLHARVLPRPVAVAEGLTQVRPTVFPSVPRVYEKIHTAVVAKLDEATGVERAIGQWALDVGRQVSVLRQAGSRSRARSRCSTGSPTGSSTRR